VLVLLGQAANAAVGRPEVLGITHEVEDGGEVRRGGREEAEEEGEEGNVAWVADVDRLVCEVILATLARKGGEVE